MKNTSLTLIALLVGGLSLPVCAVEEITAMPMAEVVPAVSEVSAAPALPALKKVNLTFMDSKLFDGKLSKELDSGKDVVEIDVSGRMPLNNIPSRIDRWLIRSADEGTVETLESPPRVHSRALFALVPMVFSAFGFLKNMQDDKMYEPAKHYDTKIYYRKDDNGDSLIDKIVLIKRKTGTPLK